MIGVPAIIVFSMLFVFFRVFLPNSRYEKALDYFSARQYDEAINLFEGLEGYKDSSYWLQVSKMAKQSEEEEKLSKIYQDAQVLLQNGQCKDAASAFYSLGDYKDSRAWYRRSNAEFPTVVAGYMKTAAITSDGTIVITGASTDGLGIGSRIGSNCLSVDVGAQHLVGLTVDGFAFAQGTNNDGQCDVDSWEDIVAIAAGCWHSVGLKSEGTVVAVGDNTFNQCAVDDWKDIVSISAGRYHTVGLKADGTVVAVGDNSNGQCDVDSWGSIVAISAGDYHTVGLKSDGSVIAAGDNQYGQCEISNWTDITCISAGGAHTVGLKTDNSVIAVGKNESGQCDVTNWDYVIAVAAGQEHTAGLKADGTVVAIGDNSNYQCEVSYWKDIRLPCAEQSVRDLHPGEVSEDTNDHNAQRAHNNSNAITAWVNGIDVRMRETPSASSYILATFDSGKEVSVTDTMGDWVAVSVDGQTGYILARYITYTKLERSS